MSARPIAELLTIPATPACGYCGTCERCIADRRRRDRECAEQDAARNRRDWLREIGIPAKYQGASYATLDTTTALSTARKYHRGEGWKRGSKSRTLLLLGPTGTGKTMAACALVSELLPDLRMSQWFTMTSALLRDLLDYRSVDKTMDRATRTSLLVVDDLVDLEPKGLALFEEVIITREAEGRPLVITSNLTPKRLNEMFSDRVVDRLRVWGDTVTCTGASLRKRPEATA